MLAVINNKIAQTFLDEMPTKNDVDNHDGIINDDNYEDYLADEIENIGEDVDPTDQLYPATDYRTEIPTGNINLGVPEDTPEVIYPNIKKLVYDGIDRNEVISFEYTNRYGDYAGLRTVEPHYTFIAQSTGNEVLVTFDRDVNDIRAFIVGNIHPNGVRYKGVGFNPRPEIMIGLA